MFLLHSPVFQLYKINVSVTVTRFYINIFLYKITYHTYFFRYNYIRSDIISIIYMFLYPI